MKSLILLLSGFVWAIVGTYTDLKIISAIMGCICITIGLTSVMDMEKKWNKMEELANKCQNAE